MFLVEVVMIATVFLDMITMMTFILVLAVMDDAGLPGHGIVMFIALIIVMMMAAVFVVITMKMTSIISLIITIMTLMAS